MKLSWSRKAIKPCEGIAQIKGKEAEVDSVTFEGFTKEF